MALGFGWRLELNWNRIEMTPGPGCPEVHEDRSGTARRLNGNFKTVSKTPWSEKPHRNCRRVLSLGYRGISLKEITLWLHCNRTGIDSRLDFTWLILTSMFDNRKKRRVERGGEEGGMGEKERERKEGERPVRGCQTSAIIILLD